jgi:hypothetical protein
MRESISNKRPICFGRRLRRFSPSANSWSSRRQSIGKPHAIYGLVDPMTAAPIKALQDGSGTWSN